MRLRVWTAVIAAAVLVIGAAAAAGADSDQRADAQIAARLTADGERLEVGLQIEGVILRPQFRYFPLDSMEGQWRASSVVERVGPPARILVRLNSDGWVEFQLRVSGEARDFRPRSRFVRSDVGHHDWLRSSTVSIPSGGEAAAAYTQTYVQQAIDYYDANGRSALVDHYHGNRGTFDGEWYMFIMDGDGIMIAHAGVPTNLGRDIRGSLGTDATGRYFGGEIYGATEAGVWVSYHFENPVRGVSGQKHSWIVRHDDIIFGSGWYEPREE